jgi:hypothetical protein
MSRRFLARGLRMVCVFSSFYKLAGNPRESAFRLEDFSRADPYVAFSSTATRPTLATWNCRARCAVPILIPERPKGSRKPPPGCSVTRSSRPTARPSGSSGPSRKQAHYSLSPGVLEPRLRHLPPSTWTRGVPARADLGRRRRPSSCLARPASAWAPALNRIAAAPGRARPMASLPHGRTVVKAAPPVSHHWDRGGFRGLAAPKSEISGYRAVGR